MRPHALVLCALLAGCAASKAGSGAPDALTDSATVSISPSTPHAGDDLHAVVSNPGEAGYTFRWSVDGTVRPDLTAPDVAASNTHRGQMWSVDLLGAGGATIATASVAILDTAPGAPTVAVTQLPCDGEALRCTIGMPALDVDSDVIAYTATWLKNGQPIDGATQTVFPGDTLPGTLTGQIGDAFACMVTASDGELTSTAMSPSTTIVSHGAVTFAFTNGSQSYTVPDCVQHVTIAAWGAQGGGSAGGLGGYAQGNMDVTGGMTIDVEVGGQNGYNGGGAGAALAPAVPANGGGASDVRVGGSALVNRVIVAGGGGGGGVGDAPGNFAGGAGGAGTCGTGFCGGAGGAGYSGSGQPGGEGGGPGVSAAHAGGAGGGGHASGGGPSCESYDAPSRCGQPGALGQGGNADAGGEALHGSYCYVTPPGGTAGGGGGYYGGGGSSVGWCGGGGGGGGSSWVGTLTAATMTGAQRSGNGQITITPY